MSLEQRMEMKAMNHLQLIVSKYAAEHIGCYTYNDIIAGQRSARHV